MRLHGCRRTSVLGRIARAILWGVAFYVGGLALGIGLVSALSGNAHDRSVEAAMTGAFVVGPIAGVFGLVLGALRSRSRAPDRALNGRIGS
jgi:hypothetical protein